MDRQTLSINKLIKNIEKKINGATNQEATEKVQKWQGIAEKKLREIMCRDGYMPGSPAYYSRSGEYPTHTAQSAVTTVGDEAIGMVGYTPYWVNGEYGYGGSVELTGLIESGYQVKTPAWYFGIDGEVRYDFRRISYFGYRPPVAIRAKVVSELQGMAASDGVRLSLG